jgi:hypothetical protein
MKTTIDLVDAVFLLVNTDAVKAAINGGVYKHKRPLGSNLQDIVINSLPVSGDQLQEVIVNLNIHLPNMAISINSQEDLTQPDLVNFRILQDLVIPLVDGAYTDDLDVVIQQQSLLEEEELKEHFLNIRLSINSPNI